MARNPMQDIVPRGGKSIRNIPVPGTRPIRKRPEPIEEPPIPAAPVETETVEIDVEKETIRSVREEFETTSSRKRNKKAGRRTLFTLGAIVAVIALALLVSSVFHHATVTVTPRAFAAAVQADYTIAFTPITVKQIGTQTVTATGEKQVEKRATGTITIYNNYNASSQRLIKNTRFQTPEGLIFRIVDSVTVPGKSGATPGSVDATVLADEAGATYNVGLKDFVIPGFKGDPRYGTFYARSKTAIAGGFSGIEKIVPDAERSKAKKDIEAKLVSDLLKQAQMKKKDIDVAFDKGYTITFTTLPDEASGSQVTIREEGTLSLAAFDKKMLSSAVAKTYIKDYKNDPVVISNIESLAFTPKGDFRPGTSDTVSFNLTGNAKFEWIYDELALKQALLSQARAGIPAILQKFPMIQKADISIRPFWRRSFPASLGDITIEKAE